ncbi:hypothetical protein L198_00690 [Cryptococcus wingfieldii CBS 7118]|uniref:Uncharacterized protein n=1 Tax=Cryptococcus wingfieldii CBS 7118 TaxID=1295528 RepID=A0A1E3K7B0_9TREE|nr:hypothetical protein L198_00690 [Cryptococcus wingfieldii CBS 7118]ODO08951.1 hypothetical protein L198_00690 [Cryptococcus wingfieldii CBS 7118]
MSIYAASAADERAAQIETKRAAHVCHVHLFRLHTRLRCSQRRNTCEIPNDERIRDIVNERVRVLLVLGDSEMIAIPCSSLFWLSTPAPSSTKDNRPETAIPNVESKPDKKDGLGWVLKRFPVLARRKSGETTFSVQSVESSIKTAQKDSKLSLRSRLSPFKKSSEGSGADRHQWKGRRWNGRR